jgi:hypothetical protein
VVGPPPMGFPIDGVDGLQEGESGYDAGLARREGGADQQEASSH